MGYEKFISALGEYGEYLREMLFVAKTSYIFWAWVLSYFVVAVVLYLQERARSPGLRLFTFLFPVANYTGRSFYQDVVFFFLRFAAVGWAANYFDVAGLMGASCVDCSYLESALPINGSSLMVNLSYTALAFMAVEVTYYFAHYLAHRVPALWAFHKVHHNATSLNPLTAFRLTVPEALVLWAVAQLSVFAVRSGFYLVGERPEMVTAWGLPLIFPLLAFYHFRHSHIRISFGVLNGFFMSPHCHQAHHSHEHCHKNLGLFTMVCDRAFGTAHFPLWDERMVMGIKNEPLKKSFWVVGFIDPFSEFFRSIWVAARVRFLC